MIFIYVLFDFFKLILSKVKFLYLRRQWAIKNKHNFTAVNSIFSFKKVMVGKGTYGLLNILTWNQDDEFLEIGNYCSIASGVKFILGGNHKVDNVSTYPFLFFNRNENEALTKGKTTIEDDVWIGTDVIILSGLTIGKGSIIAAGAVVTKSFPPYSVIGGNPAKLIKKRFNDSDIEYLLKNLDYKSDVNIDLVTGNIDNFKKNHK
ncbi:transferase hexapeptide (six repeat-containing protein) [Chryseobacterium formosense]|uniref:CatB-related O-acetyltransferase n=1 Tax=Chryseobacterium formosense TaxID=236814 RepID=UPI000689EE80|nr:CatB-related O-acetyltransferase [Chryseobacterium formosense]SFT33126.1 transferase hexapeptide (six repeat-containing protein) [Chryseobacterium formosense]